MKLLILTMKPSSHFVTAVYSAAKRRNIAVDILDLKRTLVKADGNVRVIADWIDVTKAYDLCLARPLGRPTVSEFMFNISILEILQMNETRVVNKPEAYINTCNKVLAYARMASAGLPIPESIASSDLSVIRASQALMGEKAIVKPVCGSRGKGVMYLSKLGENSAAKLPTVCQRFVRGSDYDIRAFVIGEDVAASMMRRAADAATNISRGGEPVPIRIDEGTRDLALRASAVLGCEISGVDIAEDMDGKKYILEVNSQPDFIGLQRVADVDLADQIVTFLRRQIVR